MPYLMRLSRYSLLAQIILTQFILTQTASAQLPRPRRLAGAPHLSLGALSSLARLAILWPQMRVLLALIPVLVDRSSVSRSSLSSFSSPLSKFSEFASRTSSDRIDGGEKLGLRGGSSKEFEGVKMPPCRGSRNRVHGGRRAATNSPKGHFYLMPEPEYARGSLYSPLRNQLICPGIPRILVQKWLKTAKIHPESDCPHNKTLKPGVNVFEWGSKSAQKPRKIKAKLLIQLPIEPISFST